MSTTTERPTLSELLPMAIQHVADTGDLEIHPAYSGRGMYGKTCWGIAGSFADLFEASMEIARILRSQGLDLPAPARDSMGLDSIWYWPKVPGASGEAMCKDCLDSLAMRDGLCWECFDNP